MLSLHLTLLSISLATSEVVGLQGKSLKKLFPLFEKEIPLKCIRVSTKKLNLLKKFLFIFSENSALIIDLKNSPMTMKMGSSYLKSLS